MNQILVSEKVYVTPEMKRKRKLYKIEFFLSIFLLCILSSYGIYAEYDRNKSEAVSKEILENLNFQATKKIQTKTEESIVVILNKENKRAFPVITEIIEEIDILQEQIFTANDGTRYYTIGTVTIPEIGVNYPILSTTTEELLKISPCKFWGPNPNEVGNFCIVAHNYRNSKFFSKVPTLEMGAKIEIKDLSGKTVVYEVYDKYSVIPEDTNCTDQATNGKREITLITCTDDSKERVIVKAREMQ